MIAGLLFSYFNVTSRRKKKKVLLFQTYRNTFSTLSLLTKIPPKKQPITPTFPVGIDTSLCLLKPSSLVPLLKCLGTCWKSPTYKAKPAGE